MKKMHGQQNRMILVKLDCILKLLNMKLAFTLSRRRENQRPWGRGGKSGLTDVQNRRRQRPRIKKK